MITAVITIALLSLLVATEPEHVESSHPTPEPPLRPVHKKPATVPSNSDRLAA